MACCCVPRVSALGLGIFMSSPAAPSPTGTCPLQAPQWPPNLSSSLFMNTQKQSSTDETFDSIRTGTGSGSPSCCPPQGQLVEKQERETAFHLFARVTDEHLHLGNLGKRLFRCISAFGNVNLLVAASSLLSCAHIRKAYWGLFQTCRLQQSDDEGLVIKAS